MADSAEFAFVASSVRRAAAAQRRAAEDYLADAKHGRHLAEQFLGLCDAIVEVLGLYEEAFRDEQDLLQRLLLLSETRGLLDNTRDLQLRRVWLDAAGEPAIDLGSYYFFSALARALVHPDCELTVATQNEGSYAILVDPFKSPEELGTPPIVLVAMVPGREIRTGLLHPLLVHEVGHGVSKVHGIAAAQCAAALKRDDVKEMVHAVAQEAAAAAEQAGQTIPVEDFERLLARRLQDWIEEIVCDAVATACLGATYLLSFATEVLATNVDKTGDKHPAPRQRVRLIVEQLDRLGWKPILDAHVPDFAKWIRALAEGAPGAKPLDRSPSDQLMNDVIALIGADVQQAVEQHIGDRVFRPAPAEIQGVAELLEQHVPPAQHEGEPISRPTIIAGCWLSALKQHGGTVDRLAEAIDVPELARLLPYALELSILVDRWNAPAEA